MLIFMVQLNFRDNGVKAIENLMLKRGKFDYILLETTGLADPGLLNHKKQFVSKLICFLTSGPIASIFWIDSELGSNVYLDGQFNIRTIVRSLSIFYLFRNHHGGRC